MIVRVLRMPRSKVHACVRRRHDGDLSESGAGLLGSLITAPTVMSAHGQHRAVHTDSRVVPMPVALAWPQVQLTRAI